MQLDRNINRGGRGKYALVNMRKLIPSLDAVSKCAGCVPAHVRKEVEAFNFLVSRGIITLGNETPGDQFFVMKYKDKFTAAGLKAYAAAVNAAATEDSRKHGHATELSDSLGEYGAQMMDEAEKAQDIGNRIPD